jgi:hypothetical protein
VSLVDSKPKAYKALEGFRLLSLVCYPLRKISPRRGLPMVARDVLPLVLLPILTDNVPTSDGDGSGLKTLSPCTPSLR